MPTVGSEPLLLIGDDYEAYYVKNSALLTPATALINEVICHHLLRIWNVPTPDVALVHIEKETLQTGFGGRHKPVFYDRLAFGSKEIAGATDLTEFLGGLNGKVDFRKFHNPNGFAMIGLFDMWVENEDRPPDLKNILLTPYEHWLQFTALDQAMAFRTGAYTSLQQKEFWGIEGQYCIQSVIFKEMKRFIKKEDKQWLQEAKDLFYLCVENSKAQFWEIVATLPESWGLDTNLANTIYEFLFSKERNQQVFEEFLRICQQ